MDVYFSLFDECKMLLIALSLSERGFDHPGDLLPLR